MTSALKREHRVKFFPHIFRIISEYGVRTASFGILIVLYGGVFLFFFINILFSTTLPKGAKKLLIHPFDVITLENILDRVQDTRLRQEVINRLNQQGEGERVVRVQEKQLQLDTKIQEVQNLLIERPDYPDGYAYLALLEYRRHRCDVAYRSITQAQRLDPNRFLFEALGKFILSCR